MRNKKTLSIQTQVLERGQKKANEMFSGNFSMYITYLINIDLKGGFNNIPSITSNNTPPENYKHRDEVTSAIDSILGSD